MSTTLAQLGIEIKTSGANETKTALDNLTQAAQKAQSATADLNRSSEETVKANKNAALSMELMISKLTESGAVYNARKMQVQGYANDEIALIDMLIKKNNAHSDALKINAQIEKQILDDKKKYDRDYISAYEENAKRIASADKQSYDARYKYDRDFYYATEENARRNAAERKNIQDSLSKALLQSEKDAQSKQNARAGIFKDTSAPEIQALNQRLSLEQSIRVNGANDIKTLEIKSAQEELAIRQRLTSELLRLETGLRDGTIANRGLATQARTRAITTAESELTANNRLIEGQRALAESANNTGSHYNELTRILAKTHDMLIRMAAYRMINVVFGLPSELLQTNMIFEKMNVQLEGLTGSAAGARYEMERMTKLDFKTPFDLEGLTKTMIAFKNYGLEPTDQVMKAMTDSVSKLGGGTAELIGIGRQLGQAWGKDKLQLVDMRPMIERGLPVISILSEALHKNAAEILDMSKAGTIGRKEMLLLFEAMEKWAPDAALKSMDTMYGSLSNIKSAWQQLQNVILQDKSESFIKTFFDNISRSLNVLTKYIDSTKKLYNESQQASDNYIKARNYLDTLNSVQSKTGAVPDSLIKSQEQRVAALKEIYVAASDANIAEEKFNNTQKNTSDNKLANDTKAIEMSEKSLATQAKSVDAQERYQLATIKAANAIIDAQIEQIKISENIEKDAINVKKNAIEELHKHQKISDSDYYNANLGFISQLEEAEKTSANRRLELQKSKAQESILTSEKAWQAILSVETNGTDLVNKKSMAMGSGQVLASTLIDPGLKGIEPFAPAVEKGLVALKEYNNALKFTQENEDALETWSHRYFLALVDKWGSVEKAVMHYGENTPEYMDKVNKAVDSQSGATEHLAKLQKEQISTHEEIRKSSLNSSNEQIKALNTLSDSQLSYNRSIEDEKLKQLELNGSIREAIDLKAKLSLERNPAYKEAVAMSVSQDQAVANTGKKDASLIAGNVESERLQSLRSDAIAYRDSLDSINKSTRDMGVTSTEAFDIIGGGFGKLSTAFSNLSKETNNFSDALRKNANDQDDTLNDPKLSPERREEKLIALQKQEIKLQAESTLATVKGYRQIAGEASKMFAENTAGRKAMHGIETGLSVIETVLTAKKFALELGGMAQSLQSLLSTVAPTVAAEGVKATAHGTTAVAAQGAIPFVGFALMAAMVAALAAIGVFTGGSSSSPAKPTYSPDTGTVLGDPTAKSESINNTYELLKDIQADNYPVLKSIDQGISDLHSGITDVITRLFQAGGLTNVTPPSSANVGFGMMGNAIQMGAMIGSGGLAKFDPIANKVLGFLFGGKQTSTVTAQGISTNPTSISDIMSGGDLSAQQFANIETKTKGGFFGKDKISISTQYAALDSDTQKALNGVFKSMGTTMLGLADNLGLGLSDRVKNYIIPALTVDLKGLDGEAAAKKLNGVISAALDTMSTAVFGDILGQYQQLGEGMLETAVRIVSEVAVVKDSLDKSGLSIAGDAIAISDALVQAAGGLKEFQKAFDDYYQKFYTDAERNVFSQKLLNTQLSDLNLLLPSTREEYRKLIESLNVNNEADAQRYSLLIKLSGAADSYYKILEDQANNLAQLAQQQRSLDIQYMELTGNAVGALTEKRKDELTAMDISLRFSQQSVWVMAAANKAVDDAMNVLKKSVSDQKVLNNTAHQAAIAANNVQKQSANDLLSALKTVAANLKSALQSTVIESDDFVRQRRIAAQTVLTSALSSAASGGSLANYAGLDKALVDIAKPSEQLYTSFIDFARDQGRTGNIISRLSDYTSSQVSVAEQTLIAIESNNKLLTDAFNAENTRLDALVTNGQAQIDAVNGTTAQVKSVNDAVMTLSMVINAKMTTENAIANAKKAVGAESNAKSISDAVAAQAAKSQQAVNDAIAAADKAAQAAKNAQLTAQQGYGPAPSTYINGQSGNPIWEQILSGFNAAHQARFGTPMNRAWGSDSDAQNQYQQLVAQYNVNSAAAVQAAMANAAGLASVASASAALIPGYQATALADSQSAAQAAAAYATASAYATAAKASVPGINSFAIGTNYVESDRLAMVHQGERIMPAADNEQLFNIMSNPNNNKSSDAELRLLRQEMAKLQISNAEIARTNKKMADILVNVTRDGIAVFTTPA